MKAILSPLKTAALASCLLVVSQLNAKSCYQHFSSLIDKAYEAHLSFNRFAEEVKKDWTHALFKDTTYTPDVRWFGFLEKVPLANLDPPKGRLGKTLTYTIGLPDHLLNKALAKITQNLSTDGKVFQTRGPLGFFGPDWLLYEKWLLKIPKQDNKDLRIPARIVIDIIAYYTAMRVYSLSDQCFDLPNFNFFWVMPFGAEMDKEGILPFSETQPCNPAYWRNQVLHDAWYVDLKEELKAASTEKEAKLVFIKAVILRDQLVKFNEIQRTYSQQREGAHEVAKIFIDAQMYTDLVSDTTLFLDLVQALEDNRLSEENFPDAVKIRLRFLTLRSALPGWYEHLQDNKNTDKPLEQYFLEGSPQRYMLEYVQKAHVFQDNLKKYRSGQLSLSQFQSLLSDFLLKLEFASLKQGAGLQLAKEAVENKE